MNKTALFVVIILMNFDMGYAQNNPLLGEFNTPHQTAPFDKIKNEYFLPAFQEAIKEGEQKFRTIKNNPETPTFENTIVALEQREITKPDCRYIFQLTSSETNDELQQIAQEVSPMLTKFQNDITLDPVFLKG